MKLLSAVILAAAAFTIGFLAQRSRMCFIAGLRDFILVRDGELLKGLFSFLATIWILTSLFYGFGLITDGIPAPLFDEEKVAAVESSETENTESSEQQVVPVAVGAESEQAAYELQLKLVGTGIVASPFLWLSIIGGLLLGLITTGAGGCALRQHVLAAQGNGNAKFFLIGFFGMVILYDLFLRRIINEWI